MATVLRAHSESASWRDYLELTKPRVVLLMLITSLVGMFLATRAGVPWTVLVFGNLGIGLCAGAAAAVNHVVDRRIDSIMARTHKRPVTAGRVSVPAALGTLWTVGCMHVFGLSFNLANVWGLPLLIGASAEYGFNVVLRYREREGAHEEPFPRDAMIAVALNGLTTVAGFGSMMVARHQGIFGLGLMLGIVVHVTIVRAVLVPSLMAVLGRWNWWLP